MEEPVKTKYGKEEIDACTEVLKYGEISSFRGGKEVKKFEENFANYIGTSYAVSTTSGTTALHTALSALDLPRGSEVGVPALTFISTASVVLQEGLIPVFIDIDDNFCMCPLDLKKKVSEKMKAIVPVHLYGHPANMAELIECAEMNDLVIIEDACQAHGASINGVKVGCFGSYGCFSFYETKNMSCGEGGMVVTNSEELYVKARFKREHGSPRNAPSWYVYDRLGFNYNMTNLQAAIGCVQLEKLESMNLARRNKVIEYRKLLSPLGIEFSDDREGVINVCHNLPCLLPNYLKDKRDLFVERLKSKGVPVDIAYPKPLYKTRLFEELGFECYLPRTEDVCERLFTLFTDEKITFDMIFKISETIAGVLNNLEKKDFQ